MSYSDSCTDADELLRLSQEMIRIPSVYTQEAEIADFVFDRLESWGFAPRKIPVADHGPCVVAEHGDASSPSVVLNGHMDTVEVMSGWKHDPFGAEVEDGILYGLGALDMKCGLAALMMTFRTLVGSDALRGRRVVFQAVPGEEDLGIGTRTLIREGGFRNAEAVIIGEGFGGLHVVTNGRRGGSYYDFHVLGQSAHGATPHMGKNAAVDASRLVCALEQMSLSESEGLFSDALEPLKETQTVLSIHGGGISLSVPDRCVVNIVRCTIPGGRIDIQPELEALVSKLSLECGVDIEFKDEPGDFYKPYLTDAEEPLVRSAVESLTEVTGTRPTLACGVSEADDNIVAEETGLPVICMGPGETGDMARYHRPEEAITVSQLPVALEAYLSTVRRLCQA
jgi:acetylornithine deacetylase/succinyl-diaminopimelate desuccinylase-like protein